MEVTIMSNKKGNSNMAIVEILRNKGIPVKGYTLANNVYSKDTLSLEDVEIIKKSNKVEYVKVIADLGTNCMYDLFISFDGEELTARVNAVTDVWSAFLNFGFNPQSFGVYPISNEKLQEIGFEGEKDYWGRLEGKNFKFFDNNEKVKEIWTRQCGTVNEGLVEFTDGTFATIDFWQV